jgi:low temperature requirement protein LtrA
VIGRATSFAGGRNPHEAHRVATPLELLFDLTFATSFSLAASQLADAIAAGRFMAALPGFSFASFAICWAWINFSWFSSLHYFTILAYELRGYQAATLAN